MADKRQVFQLSGEKGMGPFVLRRRPSAHERGSAVSRDNPEVEAAEAAQQTPRPLAGKALNQRSGVSSGALDVVTSLEVYQETISGLRLWRSGCPLVLQLLPGPIPLGNP